MVPLMVAGRDAAPRPEPGRPLDLLVGQQLEYVWLGHAVVLGFTGGRQVLIEAVAHLDGPTGRYDVEPGDNPSDAIATLLGDVVESAGARDTGELEIGFRGGAALLVDVDDDAESWAVTGADGLLIVCLARGELAVWGGGSGGRV
ncbi:DUF6188 family protein [Actinoplanes aureus]|uniref:Uncharacterized protein n=1 Tax=Actinoplanes aureus TaxID=2792083 RepID=A0A931G4R4_9ACTN|nr:DUF6188 family protein [Actinoplanes aureus]MBG0565544.1 hypothetical protein [Actinoplanes aureus]